MFTPGRAKGGYGRIREAAAAAATPAAGDGTVPAAVAAAAATPVGAISSSTAGFRQPSSPWASPALTPSRASRVLRSGGGKGSSDGNQPVFVCDLPHQFRLLLGEGKLGTQGDAAKVQGGMDGKSGLSWVLNGQHLCVWSHLHSGTCAILTVPQLGLSDKEDSWLVCLVAHHVDQQTEVGYLKGCDAVSVIMCSSKSLALVYWPDAFSSGEKPPIISTGTNNRALTSLLNDDRPSNRRSNSGSVGVPLVTSIVASSSTSPDVSVAVASGSDGELWRFDCGPDGISKQQIARDVTGAEVGYSVFATSSSRAWSLVWCSLPNEGVQQLLLLTSHGFECWNVDLSPRGVVTKAWTYDLSNEKDVMYDLAGQKQVWLLDLQVDESGKEFTVLVASFSKDFVTSSSHMQYSLHYFQLWGEGEIRRRAPPQIILPKARVEEEAFLYSMCLRTGGQPAGSALILAGDGTATVAHVGKGNHVRLYQFDLSWGAGKVLDACVVPGEDAGAWIVLTEDAGVWAIPPRAILLGAVQPPERGLSRRVSTTEEPVKDERRQLMSGDATELQRLGSGRVVAGDAQLDQVVSQWPSQDDEAETSVGRFFQQYLASGQLTSVLDKLQNAGAFEREGDRNVFACTSRAIVDTLAKHWASGRASGVAVLATVSSQLADKQRRHQQYLNFLAASKCHEELQHKQREALHVIMEHGEKLAGMMKLRELNNAQAQPGSPDNFTGSSKLLMPQSSGEGTGALWDTVQLVGEKARRNNVMLMDRDRVEVFYTRVSELEELFICIQQHAGALVQCDKAVKVQIERAAELAFACSTVLRVAIAYHDTQHAWYPSPEGLTPWYCKPAVRSGVWKVATTLLKLKSEAEASEPSLTPGLMTQLEEMADLLLESYAGAITAKVEREEEYRGLQMEYWSCRDTLLTALQQYAAQVAQTAAQRAGGGGKGEEQRQKVLQKLYTPLIALGRRHAAFSTLFQICMDLDDHELLRRLMRESMGLKEGRFSRFVFEQCYQQGQHARLLRLGEEFGEELAVFLEEHPELLWVHQLKLHQFTAASKTLFLVSQHSTNSTIRQRRHLLQLAKLAALAGGAAGADEIAQNVDANVAILAVQEVAAREGVTGEELLSPGKLVDGCLKSGSRELVMGAFEVFTNAGAKFCSSNYNLLEQAWLRAADQDDWVGLKKTSDEEPWSDDHLLEALQGTLLYQASKHFFGEAGMILPRFDQGFPNQIGVTADSAEAVESVLAKHPSYTYAGQVMLTAFRMGTSLHASLDERDADTMVDL